MVSHHFSAPQVQCACTISAFLLTAPGYSDSIGASSTGPGSLSATCQAYGAHIGDLIADHKEAQDVSATDLDEAITLFYVGSSLCSRGFHERAIATYDRVILGPVKRRLPFGPSGK